MQSLRDILIEELHSHLYLKAFWCDRRWTAYTPNQSTCESLVKLILQAHSLIHLPF